MAFKTSEKYKSVIYSGDCRHKLKLLFNGVKLEDADVYCESLKVTSRILPNGSTRFSLDNFIAKEAELILHDIDTTKIQSPVNISIGTLVDGTYEYVPIGLFVVQDLPTTDKNKTTIKLRDYAVKFDFGYNAKDIIDENGGSVTKLQILQDICSKAGVETDITKFYGSNSKIGIYDNTITGRTYISYLAEQAGSIATIDRSGKLIFVQLKDLETVEIPLNIVEKYEDGEKYEISRVVYEDAIRKFEYGDESKDTLFINTANPYIDDEVLTNTLTGSKIKVSDSADAEVVGYKQNGIRKQNVYSGKNKNVNAENVIASASMPASSFTNLEEYDGYKNVVEVSSNISYMTLRTNDVSSDLTETIVTGGIDITTMLLIKKTDVNTTIKFYLGDITGGAIYNELQHYKDEANGWAWYYTTHAIPASPSNTTIRNHISSPATDFSTFYIAKIQTLIGSTPSDFEPYVGGKASPSPDYPQEIEVGRGKNLFDKDNLKYVNAYNDTTTNKLTSTDTAKMLYIPIKGGETYTIQKILSSRFVICTTIEEPAIGVSTSNHTQNYSATKITITTNDTAKYLVVMYYIITSDTLTEQEILNSIQIEKGSVATSYSPYNTIESKSNSRNSWNNSQVVKVSDYIFPNETGFKIIKTTNGRLSPAYNLSLDVGNYKILGNFSTNRPNGSTGLLAYSINDDGTNTYFTFVKDRTFNVPKKFSKIIFYMQGTEEIGTYVEVEDFMITSDIDANDYEPYEESTIQHHLGDNFIADKDYIENGVLNKHIGKVVLDGSENWTLYSNDNEGISFWLELSRSIKGFNTSICDKYTNIKQAWGDKYKNEYGIYSDHWNYKYKYFRPPNADITTVDQWKAWLSENNIEMYYELETTEQIPLETTGELRTFEPNTIITNDLDSEMEVEYARNQTQVSQILELNKNIPLNSFKTGKIIGNPAIDAYDIIKIVDDDKEFKTLATNDLTYTGVMINSFDTQIGKEAKKENVTLTPEATFKKWAKTEINNVEAEVKITTGKIEEAVLGLDADVKSNGTNINNNYQELLGKFEGYTPTSQTIQLEKSVTQLQTDTYTKTEINTKLTDGSVTKVRTTSGTFDEDGMHYEKTGAPTKSTINEAGVSVDSSSSGEELLFAGYDKDINQTIVRTENLTVRRYLVIGENTRIEDYTDEDGNVGGGLFIL